MDNLDELINDVVAEDKDLDSSAGSQLTDRNTALTDNSNIRCWGINSLGQTEVPNSIKHEDAKVLTSGAAHTCTIIQFNAIDGS